VRAFVAAGLLFAGAVFAATNPPQSNFPNRIYGEIKLIDPKAGILVVQPRPGFEARPSTPPEKPGATQRYLPPDKSGTKPAAPKIPDKLTIITSPETIIYTQTPGGLEDCKVGQWARVMSTLTLKNEVVAAVVTQLPAEPPAEPLHDKTPPEANPVSPPPPAPTSRTPGVTSSAGGPPASGVESSGNRARGQIKKEVGKISSLKPFSLKLKDGKELTVGIGPQTRFVISPKKTFADLKAGKRVMISGESKNGRIFAKEILVVTETPRPEGEATGAGSGPPPGSPK